MSEREKFWLIFFEDPDKQPAVYTDEASARLGYEQASIGWNCTLFHEVENNFSPEEAKPSRAQELVRLRILRQIESHLEAEIILRRNQGVNSHFSIPMFIAQAEVELVKARAEIQMLEAL